MRYAREVVVPLSRSHGPFPDDVVLMYAVTADLDEAELAAHLGWMRGFWKRAAAAGTAAAGSYRRLIDLDRVIQGAAGDRMADPGWWAAESKRDRVNRETAVDRLRSQISRAFPDGQPTVAQLAELCRVYTHLPWTIVEAAIRGAGLPPPQADEQEIAEIVRTAITAAGTAGAVVAEPSVSPVRPRRFSRAGRMPDRSASSAVLIGVSDYVDEGLPQLPSVRGNVADLADALTHSEYGGFDETRVHRFVDPGLDVMAHVAEIADAATDALVIYYAGHGIVGADGRLYLALPITRTGREMYTAVPFEHIRRVLRESPAASRVVILDCCFSGRALEFMAGEGVAYGQLVTSGTYVLTATSATQPAHAAPGARNSAFTGALLHLITAGIPATDDLILLDDLYPQLRVSLERDGLPLPRVAGADTVGNLALVRNPAWRPTA